MECLADLCDNGQIPEYHETMTTILNWSHQAVRVSALWLFVLAGA